MQQSETLKPGGLIRSFRKEADLSLEEFADRIREEGCERPSVAKLSRIETDEQPVSLDILAALARITGRTAAELRPDIARLFSVEAAE